MATRAPRGGRPSLLLVVLALALAALIYQEVTSDYWRRLPPIHPTVPATEPELPASLPGFRMPPLAEYAATVERPLFFPDRRPPSSDEATPADAQPSTAEERQALNVVVTGVILSDEINIALVQRRGGGEVLRLAKGDIVDGWSVSEILADRVKFQRDADEQEVELREPQAKPRQGRVPDKATPRRRPAPAAEDRNPGPATNQRRRR
jgi:general secretion pathway protein N